MSELILIRGWPGSGKTTLAKRHLSNYRHFEADLFFTGQDGDYAFDPSLLGRAHQLCRDATRKALMRGENVVVSNTFIRYHELRPYLRMAEDFSINTVILECSGRFPNRHGVAPATVARMREQFEDIRPKVGGTPVYPAEILGQLPISA